MSLYVGDSLVCRYGSIPAYQTVTYIEWHKPDVLIQVILLMIAHGCSKHVEYRNKHIQKELCVKLVIYKDLLRTSRYFWKIKGLPSTRTVKRMKDKQFQQRKCPFYTSSGYLSLKMLFTNTSIQNRKECRRSIKFFRSALVSPSYELRKNSEPFLIRQLLHTWR